MFRFRPKAPKRMPLEQQLRLLADAGIRMRDGVTIDDLLDEYPPEEYEEDPFRLALVMLGSCENRLPGTVYSSDDVRTLDSECIEDSGDYTDLIKDLRPLLGDDLLIEHIQDHFDPDADEARIELRLDGQTHHFQPQIRRDWLDEAVFSWLSSLLAARGSPRRLTHLADDGQCFVLACLTTPQRRTLRRTTGLRPAEL